MTLAFQKARIQDGEKDEGLIQKHWSVRFLGPAIVLSLVAVLFLLGGWKTAVIVFIILGIVIVHELGHFLAARKSGMKVNEFSVGFGPKIWMFKRKGTRYGLRAIPGGASVRIPGMYLSDTIKPEDRGDETTYYRAKPFKARVLVALGGPATHFIMAFILLWSLFAFVGYNGSIPPEETANWSIQRVVDDSAAESAGIQPGDKIVNFDGTKISTYKDLVAAVQKKNENPTVSIRVDRDGSLLDLNPVRLGHRRLSADSGFVGFLGISPQYHQPTKNVISSVYYAGEDFGRIVSNAASAAGRVLIPSNILNFVSDTFSGNFDESEGTVSSGILQTQVPGNQTERPLTSGETPAANITEQDQLRPSSIVGIVQIGNQLFDSGIGALILFFVVVNLFLGFLNLLPTLPFDGGHVATAVYEGIRSRNGVRYYADTNKIIAYTWPVAAYFLLIAVVALYRDIADPLELFG